MIRAQTTDKAAGIGRTQGAGRRTLRREAAKTRGATMLGWEVFVYRHAEARPENLLARWTSRSVGVDWIDRLVREGRAFDLGGNGYPCLYRASAAVLLPVVAGTKLGKSFPASTLPQEAVFPADFSAIVWNLEHLKACEPDEVLLVRAFDQS